MAEVAQPGPPVREQVGGQPHALDRLAAQPRHLGLRPVSHGQPPPRRRVLRLALQQGQAGLADVGDDGPGPLAVPGLGGPRGEVVVGARDPGLAWPSLTGDPAGRCHASEAVRRSPYLAAVSPGGCSASLSRCSTCPLLSEVDKAGPSRSAASAARARPSAAPRRCRAVQVPASSRTRTTTALAFASARGSVRRRATAASAVSALPGHAAGCRPAGSIAFEPERRQAAGEQIDWPLAVGQAGPEGDVGQPGGTLGQVRSAA